MDESGSPGVALTKNDFLIASVVLFESEEEMKRVSKMFAALKEKLKLRSSYEFHYVHSVKRARQIVFEEIKTLNFVFMTFAIKKNSTKRYASYANLAKMLIEKLKNQYADEIKIILDANPVLYRELNKIKKNSKIKSIHFKEGDSAKDDRLQLVDYIVGCHGQIIRGGKEENFSKMKTKNICTEIIF